MINLNRKSAHPPFSRLDIAQCDNVCPSPSTPPSASASHITELEGKKRKWRNEMIGRSVKF